MDYWYPKRWITFLLVILHHLEWSLTMDDVQPVSGEYCALETFEAECGAGAVLVLQSARYGRMKVGKCITSDLGLSQYIGCSADVLKLADSKCSGRHRCSLLLPDPQFAATNPCQTRDLSNYLEASYICIPVIYPNGGECSGNSPEISFPSTGYLSSIIAEETGCGDAEHPWMLTASPGQTIIISLVDFNHDEGGTSNTGTCTIYAIIKEPTAQTTKTVCGGQDKERIVYQSMGQMVEIQVRAGSEKHFLFHYEFIGCVNPESVSDRTFLRNGNVGRWRCDENDVEWTVRCDGNTWVGDEKDCTLKPAVTDATIRPTKEVIPAGVPTPPSSFSWTMVLILVAIVTVGMVACVLIIAIVCLKRSRARGVQHPVTQYPLYEVYDMPVPRRVSERDAPQAYYQSLPKDYHSKKTYSDNTVPRDGRYDKPVWERPLPRPPGRGEFDA